MRRLLTDYVVSFNRRYKRHGHLFQNRYKSMVCQEDTYLEELVRYIHLNPLRAGVVSYLTAYLPGYEVGNEPGGRWLRRTRGRGDWAGEPLCAHSVRY